MSTTNRDTDKPAWLSVSARINAVFTCCNNTNEDVSNNKSNYTEREIRDDDRIRLDTTGIHTNAVDIEDNDVDVEIDTDLTS